MGGSISSLLPLQLAQDPAHPSAKGVPVPRVLEPSPFSTHTAASLVKLLLTWASRAPLHQHPRPKASPPHPLPLCPDLEPSRGPILTLKGEEDG